MAHPDPFYSPHLAGEDASLRADGPDARAAVR
jgi:hypothetical protein